MGMDVVGKKPKTKTGEYFRNNVWWWHPLWAYCHHIAPEICDGVLGHSNDGDGLPGDGARKLAQALRREIESGRTKEHEQNHEAARNALPHHTCTHCDGTGIRSDAVGLGMKMPERALANEQVQRLGRTAGWCNGCNGEGLRASWEASYSFSEANVIEFAEFLEHCGGFQIY